MSGRRTLTLEEAAVQRREGEDTRAASVQALMRAVLAHRDEGATEIARRLTEAGWPIRRQQVHNLLKGRTRWGG